MCKNKYLLFLTAVLIGVSIACMPVSSAEGMNITLQFPDGTAIQPEAISGTFSSNRRLTRPGWVRETMTCGPRLERRTSTT